MSEIFALGRLAVAGGFFFFGKKCNVSSCGGTNRIERGRSVERF